MKANYIVFVSYRKEKQDPGHFFIHKLLADDLEKASQRD